MLPRGQFDRAGEICSVRASNLKRLEASLMMYTAAALGQMSVAWRAEGSARGPLARCQGMRWHAAGASDYIGRPSVSLMTAFHLR